MKFTPEKSPEKSRLFRKKMKAKKPLSDYNKAIKTRGKHKGSPPPQQQTDTK
ncbi:MAG: hypothetical protein LUE11_01015 [Clostridia bacterium]|nr:hypothetical protein [Clostridia bacterium]